MKRRGFLKAAATAIAAAAVPAGVFSSAQVVAMDIEGYEGNHNMVTALLLPDGTRIVIRDWEDKPMFSTIAGLWS